MNVKKAIRDTLALILLVIVGSFLIALITLTGDYILRSKYIIYIYFFIINYLFPFCIGLAIWMAVISFVGYLYYEILDDRNRDDQS
jgi:uncharacterized membrane protein